MLSKEYGTKGPEISIGKINTLELPVYDKITHERENLYLRVMLDSKSVNDFARYLGIGEYSPKAFVLLKNYEVDKGEGYSPVEGFAYGSYNDGYSDPDAPALIINFNQLYNTLYGNMIGKPQKEKADMFFETSLNPTKREKYFAGISHIDTGLWPDDDQMKNILNGKYIDNKDRVRLERVNFALNLYIADFMATMSNRANYELESANLRSRLHGTLLTFWRSIKNQALLTMRTSQLFEKQVKIGESEGFWKLLFDGLKTYRQFFDPQDEDIFRIKENVAKAVAKAALDNLNKKVYKTWEYKIIPYATMHGLNFFKFESEDKDSSLLGK